MANLKRLWLIPFVVLVLWLLAGYGAAQQMPQVPPALANSKQFQRWWWAFQQRAYPLGDIPKDAKLRALQQIEQFKASLPPALQPGGNWINIGPAPIVGGVDPDGDLNPKSSGRVAAIAVSPLDPNHWLIGAAQGGIWGTPNGGITWTPLTDAQASLAMGAIAFAPSDPTIIYAGTGEGQFGNLGYAGAGLLKSTDGGNTWTLLATDTFAKTAFSDIKVDPINPDIVVVATVFGLAGLDFKLPRDVPPRGIFKSTDGGVSWSRKHGPDATDLDVDPTNFNNQYAGIGFPRGFLLNGVYRSTDAGETWTLISGPWEILPGSVGRVELAIAPSNPNVLYVSIHEADSGGLLGLFRTDNAWGDTPLWTQITSAPDFCGPFCDYAHEIIVDPTNPDILYAGGFSLWKCETCSAAAATWTDIGKTDSLNGIHVDQHIMAWAGNRLIVGNDGGVWITIDGGNSWVNRNTNLSITQFYAGSIDPSNPLFALGGSQDNGTEVLLGADWLWIFGGDGAANAISKSHPNTDWAVSFNNLGIRRTTDGGVNFNPGDLGIDKTGAPFIARFEKCPHNDDIFIAGTDNLWRTNIFFSIPIPIWLPNGPEMGSAITAMAFAPSDTTCNTYAFGTADGRLRFTSNGGSKWVDIEPITITEFPSPGFPSPSAITKGPDGALWFNDQNVNKIGRITTDGVITQFQLPTPGGTFFRDFSGITPGPDGALWFAHGNHIGTITSDGGVTEYQLLNPNSFADGITAGPDGALWFGEVTIIDPGPPQLVIGQIGRITTAGVITDEFPLPTAANSFRFTGITAGPDGNVWFTEEILTLGVGTEAKIGRITIEGVFTEFPLSFFPGGVLQLVGGITAGPDGALWFTEPERNRIGRITTDGGITEVQLPTPFSHAEGITADPNGPLWFTGVDRIGRITTDGDITQFQLPTPGGPWGITAGPDRTRWFTDFNQGKIWRIEDVLPHRFVTDLAFDPTTDPEDPDNLTLYVTFSGFDEGTPRHPGHVFKAKFKTTNVDTVPPTWSDVTPRVDDIPINIPHNTIALLNSNIVYVGTDIGVWRSTDGGMTWTHLGPETGMPNVAVFDLQISDTGRLVAFTHGRGAFVLE